MERGHLPVAGRDVVEQNAATALSAAARAYVLETGSVKIAGSADELKADDAVRTAYLGY